MVNDNISCLLLTSKMSKVAKMVCFAMGERGLLSRVLSPIFGASFTYASVKKGLETALGQPTIFELKELFRSLGVEN
jgi:3-dehydroquinate dehydratase